MARNEDLQLVDLACDLQRQGNLREAIAVFDQMIDKYGRSELYCQRGVLYSKCREFRRAITDFTDGIGINCTDADLYTNRANAYFWLGAFDAAIDDYSIAIRLSPNDAHAFNGRAQAHAELGEIDNAIRDFQEAIRIDRTYISPFFNLGVLLFQNNRFESALENLNRAEALRPTDTDVLCVRGDLFEWIGEHKAAFRDYYNAVAFDPQCVPALRRLSWMLSTSVDETVRDVNQSITYATKCCELTSFRDGYCLEALARAYAELGDFDVAVEWQAQAINSISGEQELSLARERLQQYQVCRRPDESYYE